MKTANFFLEKSEGFKTKVQSMELIPYDFGSVTNDLYQDTIPAKNAEYTEQKSILKDIMFQMKLMFSEFDNGFHFIEKLNEEYSSSLDTKSLFSNKPFADHLVKTNQLFIDFLNEYRIDTTDSK